VEKSLEDYVHWLVLGRNVRFNAALFFEVFATKAPIATIFECSKNKLSALGLSERCVRELMRAKETYTVEQVLRELRGNNIEPIFWFENDYPENLKNIYNPPFILYKKGPLKLSGLAIGIVGSRRVTDYGIQVTEKLSGGLARSGITIVSGLALGVDSVAHRSAIDAEGNTIAVIGCGLNQVYPSSNLALGKQIMENGAIISEFPFGTTPQKQNFPARNRIISGLSMGLLVTEAAECSGSLITATAALDQNKEVFAVPGSIFNKNSMGTNNLIKAGARPVTDIQDIFDEFGIKTPIVTNSLRTSEGKTNAESAILALLEQEPLHIDTIVKSTKLPQAEVSAAITLLEISAHIKHLGGNIFRLNG
jgi:DNA processing protein